MTDKFGSLENVPLRDAWSHEAREFTPWLADNLDRLSEVIGIGLESIQTEAPVEQFSADILAHNPMDDSIVLIENQLEGSDHTHLGQIMTYLAGLEAQTVVWIARYFEDAHLSAIRWLNDHTTDSFNLFAVKVKVVKIGESPLVPVFEIIEQPNDWERQVRAKARDTSVGLSARGQFLREFWSYYRERHPDDAISAGFAGYNPDYHVQGTGLKIRRYRAQESVGMWIAQSKSSSPKPLAELLEPHIRSLADALGRDPESLRGMSSPGHIRLEIDTADRKHWPQAVEWLHNQHKIYRAALGE